MFFFSQNGDIEIDILPNNEIINDEMKIDDVDLDESSSVIDNWSSLINEDLDTFIPIYDCVSTSKEKEQNESEVQLELEGIIQYYSSIYKYNNWKKLF